MSPPPDAERAGGAPLVSVVIPAYNHAAVIPLTLDSVFAQDFHDYEVIVVNDGSPDDTAAVLAPQVASGHIRYLEQSNRGQAVARNRGIAAARGKYIALLDDDDLWPPEKLSWQVAALEAHPAAELVVGQAELIDMNGHHTGMEPLAEAITFESLFEASHLLSPGQTLIRRTALRSVGGFDPAIRGAEDWDLWIRLARRAPFLVNRRTALRYRRHPGNYQHHMDRMLAAGLRVVRKNIALAPRSCQARLQRQAHAFVMNFAGGGLYRQAIAARGAGAYLTFARCIWGFRHALLAARHDRHLVRRTAEIVWRALRHPPPSEHLSP